MVQNHSLGDSFENGKGFLSKLIPDKILETVLCRNFAKNRLFWGDFGSPFSSKIWERLKSFTILKRNYLRSFLEYFGVLWTHPFFESGAPISLIS